MCVSDDGGCSILHIIREGAGMELDNNIVVGYKDLKPFGLAKAAVPNRIRRRAHSDAHKRGSGVCVP